MVNKLVIRNIFASLQKHLKEKEIMVITGPRQTGKTTIIKQLMINLPNCYYFNLDVITDKTLFGSQSNIIQFVKNRSSIENKVYLFVDEAQRLENPGLFFKGIYDLDLPLKIILTGSSTLEFRSKINEPLTGRKRLFKLFPLSFTEYVSAKEPSLISFLTKDDSLSSRQILNLLEQYLIYGGYPKIALSENIENKIIYLQELYESYVDKDVVGYLKIKDTFAFGKFVKIISQEAGNLFNIESISREVSKKNITLRNYLTALENTFICQRVLPFFSSTRTEIRKMPKLYFIDVGLRNFAKEWQDFSNLSFFERADKGILLENFVFSELYKLNLPTINFWRTKDDAEVDFVIPNKGEFIPFEVKIQSSANISRGYVSFLEKYQPKTGYIISLSRHPTRKIKNTVVRFIYPYQLSSVFSNN